MGSFDSPFLSKICIPRTILESIAEVSKIRSSSEKILKIEEYVNGLQDEMKKIDAFKRELPLCVLLLNNAILTMKDELIECKKSNKGPILEEFIPLKKRSILTKDDQVEGIKEKDKMNWLSSVQLWNSGHENQLPNTDFNSNKHGPQLDKTKKGEEYGTLTSEFVPELSLKTPEIEDFKEEINYSDFSSKCSSSATNDRSNFKVVEQLTGRKQRRSWSPELHRRFVNALRQLGGAQVATPKQIREHMQVDGLTNDEVKSHLQKYRIHTRKIHHSTKNSNELCIESSKKSDSQSGSPQGPLQLTCSSRGSIKEEDDEKLESHRWK